MYRILYTYLHIFYIELYTYLHDRTPRRKKNGICVTLTSQPPLPQVAVNRPKKLA